MTFPVPGGSTFLRAIKNLADVASKAAAYNNLSPMTAKGDMEYDSAAGVAARLPVGSAGQVLGVSGGVPAWGTGMTLLAATPAAGYNLVNGTGNIISWTAPNDGLLHRVLVFAVLHVTSSETGGQISVSADIPDGTSAAKNLFSAGQVTGMYWPITFSYPQQQLVQANTAVTVLQNSALTAGAAVMWAELWGS